VSKPGAVIIVGAATSPHPVKPLRNLHESKSGCSIKLEMAITSGVLDTRGVQVSLNASGSYVQTLMPSEGSFAIMYTGVTE
jgi:hypothetical protein